jgi:hypothetical protein
MNVTSELTSCHISRVLFIRNRNVYFDPVKDEGKVVPVLN